MQLFNSATGYAFLALSCLAAGKGLWLRSKDISVRTGLSLPYLQKVLHILADAGFILAKRGSHGGFGLAQPADKIRLVDVVEAIENTEGRQASLPEIVSQSHCWPRLITDYQKAKKAQVTQELGRMTLRELIECEQQSINPPGVQDSADDRDAT
ncbi:MAG: Rrf2 family transcriptional regulator [Planctomycetes bacterium]|nr:Rrf2 family transcriptional regulator [Planctomycetota bacterium]